MLPTISTSPAAAAKELPPAYHVPVMLRESIDALMPEGAKGGEVYVDATFGGGGHSRAILNRLPFDGRLIAFDQDRDALRNAPAGENRLTLIASNFRFVGNWLRYYEVAQADGALADLGVSSYHFDTRCRGFSFRFDAPLDMRMNTRAGVTAAELLNQSSEEHLAEVFRLYGELSNARRLAEAVVRWRANRELITTGQLVEAVTPVMPWRKGTRSADENPVDRQELSKLFQALRIAVNHEMEALEEFLAAITAVLRPGGRLVVLTYHSLEDRLVKKFMRAGNASGRPKQDFYGRCLVPLKPLPGKAATPTPEELAINPRSRSARLRVATKIEMP